MWDGTEEIEVIVENTGTAASVAQYDFIRFDWADADSNEADADDFVRKTASSNAVAITGFDSNSISFNNAAEIDFADEYAVIGVDTKNGKGVGARLTAAKDCQTAGHGSDQYANAVYFLNDEGDVEAVFVDVSGMMYTTKNGTQLCNGTPTTPTSGSPDYSAASYASDYSASAPADASVVILNGMTSVADKANTMKTGGGVWASSYFDATGMKLTTLTLTLGVTNDEYNAIGTDFSLKTTNNAITVYTDYTSNVKVQTVAKSAITVSTTNTFDLALMITNDKEPITISFDFDKDGIYDRTVIVDTSNVSFS